MSPLEERRAVAKKLYEQDRLTLREIGERIGVSHEGARLLLIGAGVEMRGRGSDIAPRPVAFVRREAPRHPRRERDDMTERLDSNEGKHLRLLAKASGGKGFPYCVARRPS